MTEAAVIFPPQLFRDRPCLKQDRMVYLVEDQWVFRDPVNRIKFHRQKLVLHRVISGFMIQGGGLDANLNRKSTRTLIKNEADNGLKNEPYTIAMARTSAPDSATSLFFITVADNQRLNFMAKNDAAGVAPCAAG